MRSLQLALVPTRRFQRACQLGNADLFFAQSLLHCPARRSTGRFFRRECVPQYLR